MSGLMIAKDPTTGKYKELIVDTNGALEVNAVGVELHAGDVSIAVDGLEGLQTTNNTTTASILAKNTEIEATADLILAKNTEVESSLNSLISANHTDLVALESTADAILAKNTEIETTADLILAKNTEVESSLNSLITANHTDLVALESTADDILAKNTELEATADLILAKNTEVESSLNSLISANHTDLVALESTADDILAKNTEIEATADLILAKNTEIESSLNSLISANHTDLVALESTADDILAKNTELETTSNSILAKNTELGTELVAIKTAVELLDNALDGNYLNVNQNIAGTDVSTNSGNKDAQTQRIVIATDDVPFATLNTHLSEIEDAVETLQACVDSNKVKVQFEAGDLNIGNVDVASSALPSGASTESTLSSMSAKLPGTLGQKANANCISTCRSSTAGAYDMSGRTTIGTAGTSTKLLCDAAGHLQVDVVSGGGSTDVSGVATHAKQDVIIGHIDGIEGLIGTTNSGLSSIDSGITDIDGLITDGNALLTTIDSDTNNIKTAVETLQGAIEANGSNAIAVRSDVYFEGVASETNSGNKNDNVQRVCLATDDVPLATANAKLVEIETTSNSILAKNTEIETTANSILAKNTEMETSLDALISANHTDLEALEATLTEIAPRQAVAGVYSNASLADDGISSVIDTDDYRYMTICASQGSADLPLEIQYSINNSNWFKVRSKLLEFAAYEGGSWADIVLEHPMRYVRFVNTSGSSITTLYLSYQLAN